MIDNGTYIIRDGIYKIAAITLKNPKYIEMLTFKSMREAFLWGYNIERLKIEAEKVEVKQEIWDTVKVLGMNQDESIKAAKALYFLYNYANREL